jgi:hypothetical protein
MAARAPPPGGPGAPAPPPGGPLPVPPRPPPPALSPPTLFDQLASLSRSELQSAFSAYATRADLSPLATCLSLGADAASGDGAGGPTVYTYTTTLLTSLPVDWYGYFFAADVKKTTVVLQDLPLYLNGRITVTISGSGTVKCGGIVVGQHP